jgi:tRNA pseudouridine32 synthase/23S rRNA pseudouridine746 synthase
MVADLKQNHYLTDHSGSGFDVVYADGNLVVLDKPSGLLAVPGRGAEKQDSLSRRVQQHYPDALIVHRLDQATSGLMLMARGPAMQTALAKLFESRQIYKRYIAVVDGDPASQQDASAGADGWRLIDLPISVDWPRRPLRVIDPESGKPSQTRWRVMDYDATAACSRVELEPLTGRSHQLRVYMQALGNPVLGDRLYANEAVLAKSQRLLLHACSLAFVHPVTGRTLCIKSPADF